MSSTTATISDELQELIKEKVKELEFRRAPTTTWNGPFSSKNMKTGEFTDNVDIGDNKPTGIFAATQLYDVNKFCWGIMNTYGVLASVNEGDIIYFNTSDTENVVKLAPKYIGGAYVLGSGNVYHELSK